MTFYIPPVFLFGNKVRHNQEKKKAEYKTATETEIKVENWRVKRIAELEEENKVIKEEKEMLIKQNTLLQESNKKLKEELSKYEKQYQHSMWFSDFWWYYLDNNK